MLISTRSMQPCVGRLLIRQISPSGFRLANERQIMSAMYEYSTCRHCQGDGCVHCSHKGQFRKWVYSRENAALRESVFGRSTGQLQHARETERVLHVLRAM